MTIISQVNDKKNEIRFPKLMSSKEASGLIVLFQTPRIGTVLTKIASFNVGEYHTDWDPTSFYDYTGTITLENEQLNVIKTEGI
jgi:hypothetical protein